VQVKIQKPSNYPGLNNTFEKGFKINSSYQKTFFLITKRKLKLTQAIKILF
jgi:hypothetical protein